MKGCVSSLLTDQRLFGSFSRQASTKLHNSGENLALFKRYGSLVEIKYIAFNAGSLKYGGSP
jgi:hypothetical protein